MSLGLAFVAILAVALAAGWFGFARARRLRIASGTRLHSLPTYHGAYAALWAAIPALLLIAAWAPMQSRLVDQAVLSSPEGQALPAFEMQRDSILSEAREIAHGEREVGFNPESTALAPQIRSAEQHYAIMTNKRLLLVEDDRALADLVTFHFERSGYDVTRTGDGEEALILADEVKPDIVLLDWMIEGISGIEVCRRLRRRQVTANVPIIM